MTRSRRTFTAQEKAAVVKRMTIGAAVAKLRTSCYLAVDQQANLFFLEPNGTKYRPNRTKQPYRIPTIEGLSNLGGR